MIFINLPVKDLTASRAFFAQLGFEFNRGFSDDGCACIVVDQNIYVMLLAEDRFRDFINGEISDAANTTEVTNCLSAESRQQVDDLVSRAISAGGKPWKPTIDEGPVYGGSFQDLDGHVWELMHMDQGPEQR
jgi:predicted lactoylglutathione lyase